ncbi:hypothetical protein WME95_01225 [Sorangium sp. So ce327]|uniref:hypothetical protein n=1 Tax=Sorangium sp. So ce327 TaxID=3133301 RepID=UPI003F5DEB16
MNMGTSKIVRGMGVVVFGIVGLALAGCVGEELPEDMMDGEALVEDVMETAEAIGPECAAALPTQTFSGGIDAMSPQTYNTEHCYKAVVYDVTNYSASFTGPGSPSGGTRVWWGENSTAATQAECEKLWVRADLFVLVAGQWVYLDRKEANGEWVHLIDLFDEASCWGPGLVFTDLDPGKTYRVAATARTNNTSSAPTRRVRVRSDKPVYF